MDAATLIISVISFSSIAAVTYLAIRLHATVTDAARLRIIEASLESSIKQLRADLRVQEIRANEAVKNEHVAIVEAIGMVDKLPHGDRRNLMLKQWEARAIGAADRDAATSLPNRATAGTIGRAIIDPLVRAGQALRGADERAGSGDGSASSEAGDLDRGVGSVSQ